MKLSKTDQKVLDVIDRKLPFSVLMISGSRLVYKHGVRRSIEQLKTLGVIYKDEKAILHRTSDLVELYVGLGN